MPQVINFLLLLLCYIPYLDIIVYYSYVIRAIIKLGRIPSYDNPDPKTLGFTTHRDLVYTMDDIVVYGLGSFVLLWLIARALKQLTLPKIHLKMYLIGIGIFVLYLVADPFMTWFAD